MKYEVSEETLDKLNNNEDGFSLYFNYEDDLTLDLSDAFVMKANEQYARTLLEDKVKYLEDIKNNPEEYYSKHDVFNIEEIFIECGIEDWIDDICDSIESEFNNNLQNSIKENITSDTLEINEIYEKINNSITDIIYKPDLEELYEIIIDSCPEIDEYMNNVEDYKNANRKDLGRIAQ